MTEQSSLRAQNLGFRYGQRTALDSVSLSLLPGQFHVLLGPNGAGKSTLFGMLTGLLSIQQGSLEIGDQDLSKNRVALLRRTGVVFQQSALDLDLSIRQNLSYHASLHGLSPKEAKLKIDLELDRFELSHRGDESIRQLNGGHRRRVELARALLHSPEFLLLDEPTVGLDSQTRQRLNKVVRQRCATDGVAVLWATHLMEEVDIEDQISLINSGEMIFQGSTSEMLKRADRNSVAEAFNQLTGFEQEG